MRTHGILAIGCAAMSVMGVLTTAKAAVETPAWTLSSGFQAGDKDADGNDGFGISVGLSGDLAIVGAQKASSSSGTDTGAAYIYDISDPSNVSQERKLVGSDNVTGDLFGEHVALGGGYVVASARYHDDKAGAAYVFDAATGTQLHKWSGTSNFGNDVTVNGGGQALVGNYLNDQALLYDAGSGSQEATLTAGTSGGHFGFSLAVSGNTALVGAIDDDGMGSAYLYDIGDPSSPTMLNKLQPGGLAAGGRFGDAVAISGDIAVVGSRTGDAYLFNIADPGSPTLIAEVSDPDSGNATFGRTVATDGNLVLIGDDHGGDPATGTVSLYSASDGSLLGTLEADDSVNGDRFGHALSIGDGHALVGAFGFDNPKFATGKAYLFSVPEPASAGLMGMGALLLAGRRRRKSA